MKYFEEINIHKYIYLIDISEPNDNSLKLLIEEASIGEISNNILDPTIAISETRKIEHQKNDSVYEIFFDEYIGYSILDESYALPDDDECFEGRIFCIYSKSNFLNYIKKTTYACDDHPGPFKHYGFNCLNHIVDVVSTESPEIKKLA